MVKIYDIENYRGTVRPFLDSYLDKVTQETEDQQIDSSETILYLENKQLSNQIQMSLWGEVNESFYLQSIKSISPTVFYPDI